MLHFAQISDIHLTQTGHQSAVMGEKIPHFLNTAVLSLNNLDDLDFVLISGDLVDTAASTEFDRFRQTMLSLEVPYYVIPGNHDRRNPEDTSGLTYQDFVREFNPHYDNRPDLGQQGYWSRAVKGGFHLIGLDSVKTDDWGGFVDEAQQQWLRSELEAHSDEFVIVAVHHPLHKLAPIDDDPDWVKFICDNGADISRLLDDYPQVKLVLTGHHHMNNIQQRGQRLHMCCPALGLYPCAYRLLQVERDPARVRWQTVYLTDETTLQVAQARMREAWQSKGFGGSFLDEHVALALGSEYDHSGHHRFEEA